MVTKVNQPAREIVEEMVAEASRSLREGSQLLNAQSKI